MSVTYALKILSEIISHNLPDDYPDAEEVRTKTLPAILYGIAESQKIEFHWPLEDEDATFEDLFGFDISVTPERIE